MLDINLIREEPEKVKEALLKRMEHVDFDELLQWDRERRRLITEAEEMKARRNKVSDMIPRLKKEGSDTTELIDEMRQISDMIKEKDRHIKRLEDKIQGFLELLPNIPADDVVGGGKENNQVINTYGEKPHFNFQPKDHMELVTSLGLVDYERGVKIGGNGFWAYTGMGARIEW